MPTGATPKSAYRKIPGVPGSLVLSLSPNSHRLLLGGDHLLSVKGHYTEHYHRFYFRDIQGIIVQPTRGGNLTTILLSVLLFLILIPVPVSKLLIAGSAGGTMNALAVCAAVALPPLLLLALHLAGGPACRCFLKTAVQLHELPALARVRRARKALAYLRPLLEAAQADLPPLSRERYQPDTRAPEAAGTP